MSPSYFNFFDRDSNRGGFIRIGNRANEGYAEMTVIVFNSDGSPCFLTTRSQRYQIHDEWNAGGVRVEVLEPGERAAHNLRWKRALYMHDPRDMKDPVQGPSRITHSGKSSWIWFHHGRRPSIRTRG